MFVLEEDLFGSWSACWGEYVSAHLRALFAASDGDYKDYERKFSGQEYQLSSDHCVKGARTKSAANFQYFEIVVIILKLALTLACALVFTAGFVHHMKGN